MNIAAMLHEKPYDIDRDVTIWFVILFSEKWLFLVFSDKNKSNGNESNEIVFSKFIMLNL